MTLYMKTAEIKFYNYFLALKYYTNKGTYYNINRYYEV